MKTKKALVTGGAGFIGSHLCELLVGSGWEVSVVDDLSSSDGSNIRHLIGRGVALHERDIRDLDFMASALAESDALFHLAAMVSVPLSVKEPRRCYEVNVTAFSDMLELLGDRPIPVVYASSAAVYGEGTDDGPRRESEIPMPQSPYGASKAMGELIAAASSRCYAMPTVGLRFFNVYGPRQNPKGAYASVIPRFIKAVIEGRRPEIFGDGEQTRDFISVRDIARVMIMAADSAVPGDPKVMNVGSGRRESVMGIYRIISRMVPSSEPPLFLPERPGDIRHSFADLAGMAAMVNLSSFVPLEEGIRETLKYYREGK